MINFESPAFFLLAPPLLALLFLSSRHSHSMLSRKRNNASLFLRSLLVLGILALLADPFFLDQKKRAPETWFLLDVSESISDHNLEKAISYIEASRPGSPSGLIAFAGKAELLRPLSRGPLEVPREDIYDEIRGDSTLRKESLESAQTDFKNVLTLAATLGIQSQNLVLLSDGRDPLQTFPSHPSFGGTIIAPQEESSDAAVVGIRHPLAVRTGEPFDVRLDLFSSSSIQVNLLLQTGQNQWKKNGVLLPPGRTTVLFSNLTGHFSGGPHTLHAFLQSEGDSEPRNNFGTSPLIVMGKTRLLLIEGDPGNAQNLSRMLTTHNFQTRIIQTHQIPSVSFDQFHVICSVGLQGRDFSLEFMKRLTPFIENGGGFWFLARPDQTAGTEYATSPIANLLPVEFDATIPQKQKPKETKTKRPSPATKEKRPSPTIALLLVVDKSGSMAGPKLELVKEACRVTGDTLSPEDSIGVIAFDAKPKWALEFTSPTRKAHIRDRIYRILADGGTDMYPAIQEAYRGMKTHPRVKKAGIRHIILFSDGDTREADFRTLVTNMAEEGITLSTVCILRGKFDPILMNNIAHYGKGRFTSTGSFSQIPKIFTEEARALLRETRANQETAPPAVLEPESPTPPPIRLPQKTVQPKILIPHEILWKEIPKRLPPLSGILKAKEKPHARTPIGLEKDKKGALLSLCRFGLGKVAVWTSDLSGIWSSEWIRWTPFAPQLFAQLVRHLADSGKDLDFASRIEFIRNSPADQIQISPGIPGETIDLFKIGLPHEKIPFYPGVDGTLFSRIPRNEFPSTYTIQKTLKNSSEKLTFQINSPYSPEYSPLFQNSLQPSPPEKGPKREGKKTPLQFWMFVLIAPLLPFEILTRRWR